MCPIVVAVTQLYVRRSSLGLLAEPYPLLTGCQAIKINSRKAHDARKCFAGGCHFICHTAMLQQRLQRTLCSPLGVLAPVGEAGALVEFADVVQRAGLLLPIPLPVLIRCVRALRSRQSPRLAPSTSCFPAPEPETAIPVVGPRSSSLGLALAYLARLEIGASHRKSGDRDRLAPKRL